MAQRIEKIVTPEKVVLRDGRKGYFISAPVATGAVVVIKYPSSKPSTKSALRKTVSQKKTRHSSSVGSSITKALKEVKSRKKSGKYPTKDFDILMDEL
jgi:hypothetical protein